MGGNVGNRSIGIGKDVAQSNTGEKNLFIGMPGTCPYNVGGGAFGITTNLEAPTGLEYSGKQSIGIGLGALASGTGDDVIALGNHAGVDAVYGTANTLNNQFIISNDNLPSFANRAAAVAAINLVGGAAADNTYLYYNQATFCVEAVRL